MGDSEVFHVPLAESDHCGILVELKEIFYQADDGGGGSLDLFDMRICGRVTENIWNL